MFLDSLCGTGRGSTYVHCNCGFDHYAIGDNYYPAEVPEESDTVKHHSYHSVFFYVIEGRNFVYECEGCLKYLKRYETFIWNERDIIRQYLKIRVDQELKWAEHEKLMNKLIQDYGAKNG